MVLGVLITASRGIVPMKNEEISVNNTHQTMGTDYTEST